MQMVTRMIAINMDFQPIALPNICSFSLKRDNARPFLRETGKFMWVTKLEQLPACPVGFQWLVAPVQCAGFPGTSAGLNSNEFGCDFGADAVAGANAACATCANTGNSAHAGAGTVADTRVGAIENDKYIYIHKYIPNHIQRYMISMDIKPI